MRRNRSRIARGIAVVAAPLLPLAAAAAGPQAPQTSAGSQSYSSTIKPLIERYCAACHSGHNPSGDLNLAAFADIAAIRQQESRWLRVRARLNDRTMPPASMPQPTATERSLLSTWLGEVLGTAAGPGRVTIHRLNRTEYNNTIRDLLGVDTHPADSFPADGGGGGGFDNDADTLFVPPILMERYIGAATDLLSRAPRAKLLPNSAARSRDGARSAITAFASRAYRRPISLAETNGLLKLYDAAIRRGRSPENAVRYALKAVLISPDFLFRVERDRPGATSYPVSDFELASRLSYFLWSSMPDDTLFKLAATNRLHDPAVLSAQVQRMIASPRARSFSDNFAGQWLKVRDLYANSQPDPNKFKWYTPTLRDAMYQETIDFFESVVRTNASLLDLLDCDYAYLNEDLAKHYGIEGVTGSAIRRVTLPDRTRGGVLTMGSVLTLTSFPQRTSPVLRGKWVLGEILGSPPPPPPPDAGGLSTNDAPEKGLTFRQRLEKHRSSPQCASCHSRMDPIGFGLENFDATGKWRTDVGGAAVDAGGVMPDGSRFDGPVALKQVLLARKGEFVNNLASRMLAYALGRGLETYDEPTVKSIAATAERSGYKSQVLITEIVKSLPFRCRRGSGGEIARN